MIQNRENNRIKICLLEKKRGNFSIQEKYDNINNIVDTTKDEVKHHFNALIEAGYDVTQLEWDENILSNLKKLDIDIIFNLSSIVETAILEELEIPFVGSDVSGCVLSLNKNLAKDIWAKEGLQTSSYFLVKSIKECEMFKKSEPINYPLFIKPSKGRGSSGIDSSSLINTYEELVDGVKKRLETINQPVLIERFLKGREITCGIIGNNNRIRALPLLEIIHEGTNSFITFNKKEIDDDKFCCPALLSLKKTKELQQLAISAFKSIGLRDYGRVDMILTEDGPYLLEINSFAGLMCTPKEKPHSYMGFMAQAEKKKGSEFLDEIIREALTRIEKKPINKL